MQIIRKYFDYLSESQYQKLEQLESIYAFWNSKINVISRKDFENFYERHVLHSLSIGLFFSFKSNENFVDVGTGGGFPGIPLSILFPDNQFVLIDSIGKKINVVNQVIKELQLQNVTAMQVRSLELKSKFNYVISRAVSTIPQFISETKHLIKNNKNEKKAIIYLKGGEVEEELRQLTDYKIVNIKDEISNDFFSTKKIIWINF